MASCITGLYYQPVTGLSVPSSVIRIASSAEQAPVTSIMHFYICTCESSGISVWSLSCLYPSHAVTMPRVTDLINKYSFWAVAGAGIICMLLCSILGVHSDAQESRHDVNPSSHAR